MFARSRWITITIASSTMTTVPWSRHPPAEKTKEFPGTTVAEAQSMLAAVAATQHPEQEDTHAGSGGDAAEHCEEIQDASTLVHQAPCKSGLPIKRANSDQFTSPAKRVRVVVKQPQQGKDDEETDLVTAKGSESIAGSELLRIIALGSSQGSSLSSASVSTDPDLTATPTEEAMERTKKAMALLAALQDADKAMLHGKKKG